MPGPNSNSTRYIPQRKRDDVPFCYTPSDPFDLGAVPWHPSPSGRDGAELPEVSEVVKTRNDALLSGLQEEVRDKYEEREESVKALRWRGAVWAKQAVGDRLEQTATPIDDALPKAFQFHQHAESMKLHWTRGSKADENALVRPTPSHLFVTPRPRAGNPLDAPPQATSSSTISARMSLDSPASASHSPTSRAPATPALQEGTSSSLPHEAAAASQIQSDDDCLLTISIYSRPLLKPDRRTLLRTVAEKGYEERRKVEQERAASVTKKSNRGRGQSGQDDDDDDDEDEPASSQAGSSKDRTTISHRDTPLFAPQFGPTSSSADSYSSSSPDLLPRPTQVLEIYASQTLQELRDAIVCRMDDLPERDVAAEQRAGGTGGGLRFTGKKRSGDAVMVIEGLVVGQEKDSRLVEALLKADTSKSRRAAARGVTMDMQRLDFLGVPVRLHTPYWFAHQDGACEHFWVIDQVRRPTAYDPLAPAPPSSSSSLTLTSTEQPIYRTPLTLYLSSSALSRPLPLYEQPCAGEHQYGMGRCKLCDRDQALFAVVGGAAAAAEAAQSGRGGGGGGDEGVAVRVGVGVEQGKGPPNLPEQVMALCKRCALLWSGRAPRSVTAVTAGGQAVNGEVSSSGSQPASQVNGNVNGKRKRVSVSVARDRDRDRAGASRGRSGFGPGRGRGRGRGGGGGGGVARGRPSTTQPDDQVDDGDDDTERAAANGASSSSSQQQQPPPAPPSPGAISRQIAAKAELNADISGDATWRALCGVGEGQAEGRRNGGAGPGAAVQPWSVVPLLD